MWILMMTPPGNTFGGRHGADHDTNMIFHIGKNTRTSSLTMCASICIECWLDREFSFFVITLLCVSIEIPTFLSICDSGAG